MYRNRGWSGGWILAFAFVENPPQWDDGWHHGEIESLQVKWVFEAPGTRAIWRLMCFFSTSFGLAQLTPAWFGVAIAWYR